MDMVVPGVGPGPETTAHLRPMLLMLRSLGAFMVLALYGASLVLDEYLLRVVGVRVSVVELLILVGVLSQANRLVRRPACVRAG